VSEAGLEQPPAPERPRVDPWMPCILAWLLPGLGHWVLGKKRRAAVFLGVVLAMFGLGLASDGASALVDRTQPLSYLAVFDNLALGPLDLVGRYLTYGRLVYTLPGGETDPARAPLMERLRERIRGVTFEYGNAYLLTAGLMNMLLVLDAFDIASGRKD
jgi:Family of unknown function (DUF6677)